MDDLFDIALKEFNRIINWYASTTLIEDSITKPLVNINQKLGQIEEALKW